MFRHISLRSVALPIRTVMPRANMSGGGNMHGNDPEVIDKEMKREKKHEDSVHEHAPGWNETLASESEAHVKADSHDGKPDPAKTIEYLKKRDADDESATTNKSSS